MELKVVRRMLWYDYVIRYAWYVIISPVIIFAELLTFLAMVTLVALSGVIWLVQKLYGAKWFNFVVCRLGTYDKPEELVAVLVEYILYVFGWLLPKEEETEG